MSTIYDWISSCTQQHDVICNQKYDDIHNYSFHLRNVDNFVCKFMDILSSQEQEKVRMAAWGHDLIEDARITYSDIVHDVGEQVADIIFCCTEEKGRNRKERHSDQYYKQLALNRLAVYVKLCDVIANVTYSLATCSSMYNKYRSEFKDFKAYCQNGDEFLEIWIYLERLLKVNN